MFRRIAAAATIAAAVVELSMLADAATDRRLSRRAIEQVRRARERAMREREVERAARWVVFEAIEAIREDNHR